MCGMAMSMKDELDRLKSRAIDWYIYFEGRKGIRVHATKWSNAVVAKAAVHTLFRRTAGMRQARERDVRARYDDE